MNPQKVPENVKEMMGNVISKITPTPEEISNISTIVEELAEIIEHSNIPNEIIINFIEPQGSTGIKQTSIRNAADIDLFIGIDPEYIFRQKFRSKSKRREFIRDSFKNLIKNWLIPALKSHGVKELSISYAEHPYISASYKNTDLDIVLCFDLPHDFLMENGPITAVDRTPHHSRFIRDQLSKEQRDQVRLLKHIFKNFHCYGDKTAVGRNGFMGYAAELLIVYYNEFWNVLYNFKDLDHTFINFFDRIKINKEKALQMYQGMEYNEIIKAYFPTDTLIIIDPTDFKRNVASSISPRTYNYMKCEINEFLNDPNPKFFQKNPIKPISDYNLGLEEKKRYHYCMYKIFEEEHYTKFRDKLYSLMHKIISTSLREKTGEKRFQEVMGELIFDKKKSNYILAFYTKTPEISKKFLRKGPKITSEEHMIKFRKKHPDNFENEGFIWDWEERNEIYFVDFLKRKLNKEKISNLELIKIGSAEELNLDEGANRAMGLLYDIKNKNIT